MYNLPNQADMEEYNLNIVEYIKSPLGTPLPESVNAVWPLREQVALAQWRFHISNCEECKHCEMNNYDYLCPLAEEYVPLLRSRT